MANFLFVIGWGKFNSPAKKIMNTWRDTFVNDIIINPFPGS